MGVVEEMRLLETIGGADLKITGRETERDEGAG